MCDCKSYIGDVGNNVIEDSVDVCVLVGHSMPHACLEVWSIRYLLSSS